MRRNPERRTALLDAAIEVLAHQGSRGLTFRAVDGAAGVPNGTTSNYFANRDDLLDQVARRTRERLSPVESELTGTMREPPSHELETRLLTELLERMRRERASYLAMLELRLEATRRPELRTVLLETLDANLRDSIRFHLDAGLPGDETTVVLLFLAMNGLIVEDLTVPEVLARYRTDELIAGVVERILPKQP